MTFSRGVLVVCEAALMVVCGAFVGVAAQNGDGTVAFLAGLLALTFGAMFGANIEQLWRDNANND